MNDPIISREQLALDADAAAQRFLEHGVEQDCPYVSGTEAHREWRECFKQSLAALRAAGVSA